MNGLDALTVLASYATATSRVQLDTAVVAIQSHTSVVAAMSFAPSTCYQADERVLDLGWGA